MFKGREERRMTLKDEMKVLCFRKMVEAQVNAENAREVDLKDIESFFRGQMYAFHCMSKWIEGIELKNERGQTEKEGQENEQTGC